MRYPNAPRPCLISCLCSLVLIVLVQASAIAQDSVRVAYIDPLSGGGASIGEVGVKTFQFMGVVFDLADRISVLVYGQIIASDAPAQIKANVAVQQAYLGTAVA